VSEEKEKKVLFGGDAIKRLDSYINANKTLWWFTFVLLAIILIQTYALLKIETYTVVELPETLIVGEQTKIKVGNNFASDEFWRIWARGIISDLSVINADENGGVQSVLARLSTHMTSGTQVKHHNVFEGITNLVLKEKASHRFTPEKWNVNVLDKGSRSSVVVSGIGEMTVGRRKPATGKCEYKFEMKKEAGYVYITAFATNCFDVAVYRMPDGVNSGEQ
jgi:hypothetical protein